MGGSVVTPAPTDDYRVEHAMKQFDIPIDYLQKLWRIYSKLDETHCDAVVSKNSILSLESYKLMIIVEDRGLF